MIRPAALKKNSPSNAVHPDNCASVGVPPEERPAVRSPLVENDRMAGAGAGRQPRPFPLAHRAQPHRQGGGVAVAPRGGPGCVVVVVTAAAAACMICRKKRDG